MEYDNAHPEQPEIPEEERLLGERIDYFMQDVQRQIAAEQEAETPPVAVAQNWRDRLRYHPLAQKAREMWQNEDVRLAVFTGLMAGLALGSIVHEEDF
jgi:hypothetical protein